MNGEQNIKTVLDEIEKNGKAVCYTKGFSMRPMLREGRDISVLYPLTREPEVGDVVLFIRPKRDNELVLHRVVKVTAPGKFIIRGDNTYLDEPVKRENIIAVLGGFFRKGKYTDCTASKGYRVYNFYQVRLYFLRKFFLHTMRIAGAKVKNNVFHLNNFHLDDIFKKK
ncbi:MAG: S24/S26 family peptidase [Clostridia bacterium]|nr:S24/S26 family peptidase [Clostridia bacterium]